MTCLDGRLQKLSALVSVFTKEPDLAVLNAKSVLLTQANYSVTLATNDSDLFSLQTTKAFALAILSDRLGRGLLGAVAQIVRKQWPRARILIMGEVPRMLEDYLYDEQICRSSDPKQVLANLEGLYEGMWNERSKSIDWNASRSAPCFSRRQISESDPTKTGPPAAAEDRTPRDMPTDIRIPVTRAN